LKQTNCTPTCDAGDPDGTQAAAFGQTGEKFVGISAGGTNTSIPLIIKTLSLPSVVVHKTATLTLKSFGGTGSTITWTGQSLPSWVMLSPANGVVANSTTGSSISLLVNKPPAVGAFTLSFRLTDQ